jgi:hypothetical protein
MLKSIFISLLSASFLFVPHFANADIYSWVNEEGVRSYSNTLPPEEIDVKKEAEIPFDEAAYEARRAAEEQAWINRKIQLEEEQNDRLKKQLKQTKLKLEQLELKTQEALNTAQEAKQTAEKRSKRRRIYPCYPYPTPYPGIKPYPGLAPYPDFKMKSEVQIPNKFKSINELTPFSRKKTRPHTNDPASTGHRKPPRTIK